MHTFLDFSFLKTLPEGQVRNGFAELIKISTCAHKPTFDLLDKYCEKLITSRFGREGNDDEVLRAADEINRAGIYEMLKLETPNLHEIGLDRVIAYGHTWSPLHEVRSLLLLYTYQTNLCSFRPPFLYVTVMPSPSTWHTPRLSPTCVSFSAMRSIVGC